MTDSVMGFWTYTYDDFNRLTSRTATAGVDNGLTLGWTYDRYGNRWAQNATGSGNASAVQPQLTFYGSNGVVTNRIDGWSYNAAGNLLNDQINNYTYDAENRIATLNSAPQYIYDAEGRRVAKTNSSGAPTSVYVLGLGGEQVTELNGSGGWVHTNVFAGGGRLLATYEGPAGPSPNTYHYHLTDWLGTNRMQANASGNQEEVCYSYPFGDGLLCKGTVDSTEHHFTGKERDTESGNDYFFARYYTSDLGRFLTPDWASAPTAVPYATFGDPQTLNLYAYVNNNPGTEIDMSGHWGPVGPQWGETGWLGSRNMGGDPNTGPGGDATQNGTPFVNINFGTEITEGESRSEALWNTPAPSNPNPPDPTPTTDYVDISYWWTGAGGFGHIGIGVDTVHTEGFSTADPKTPWYKRLFGAPLGRTEDDIGQHTKNGEVARRSDIRIAITATQAAAMKAAMAKRTADAGHYNIFFRNCAGFVESVLHAGGVQGVPHSWVFGPAVLGAVLAYEQTWR